MEEKLAKLASLLPSVPKIEPIELAPALLVVMVLLTHFSLGFLPVLPRMSYADVMCLGGVAAVMAFLPLSGRLANRETPRHLACALAFLVCIAFTLSKVPGAQWHGFAVLASSFFAGAFVALGSALWFEHFANRPMESIALSLACCLVCGAFLAWFLIGTGADRFAVGYCVVVLLAGVSLDSSLRAAFVDDLLERGSGWRSVIPPRSVLALLSSTFMLCFTAMLAISFAGRQAWHSDEIWLVVLPATLAIPIVVLFMRKIEAGILLNVALVVVAGSLLCSSFFPIAPSVLFVIATNGLTLTVALTILFMANLSKRLSLRPCKMGAWAVLASFVGCAACRLAVDAVMGMAPDAALATSWLSISSVMALIVCVSVSMNSKSLAGMMRHEFNKPSASASSKEDSRERRIDRLASERGLGAREREALGLLLQGCSASEVADKMFIANGTAKAHIRHIYQKFGVNTREELFAAAENDRRAK